MRKAYLLPSVAVVIALLAVICLYPGAFAVDIRPVMSGMSSETAAPDENEGQSAQAGAPQSEGAVENGACQSSGKLSFSAFSAEAEEALSEKAELGVLSFKGEFRPFWELHQECGFDGFFFSQTGLYGESGRVAIVGPAASSRWDEAIAFFQSRGWEFADGNFNYTPATLDVEITPDFTLSGSILVVFNIEKVGDDKIELEQELYAPCAFVIKSSEW